MISQTFAKLYHKLNSAQKQAVDTVEGPVMVIAGPGTGKTQILTLRIASILESTQMNPENILALTFTESAVHEMRRRLIEIIGNTAYRININTFHGFCNEIIQDHSEEFEDMLNAESITELEQVQLIEEIFAGEPLKQLKPFGDPGYYIYPSLKAISDLKKEGITPERFQEALETEEADLNKAEDRYHEKGAHKGKLKSKYVELQKKIEKSKELAFVYGLYQKELRLRKRYDFNDMLLEVIHILRTDDTLLLQLQERYQYILVDEHQDTNAAQNTIIELLSSFHENPNLFVVGDEKQAIFRFQGASLENFLYFKKLYPGAILINLQENYRSSQIILNAAGSLIQHNTSANALLPDQTQLEAKSERVDEQIRIAPLHDFYAEYYFIANEIERKISQKVSPREIAVLARNNKDLIPLAEVFEQRDIPYVIETDKNILHDIEIQKLIQIFRAIKDIGNDIELIKALHTDCLSIHPLDIYKLNQFARKQKKSMWDVITSKSYKEQIELINEETLLKVINQLVKWHQLDQNSRFDDVFVTVIHESCLLQTILRKSHATDSVDHLTGLFENIRFQMSRNRNYKLNDFLTYVDLLTAHKLPLNSSGRTVELEAVRLITAHKSKGLEFDSVFIINAYDGHWSNIKKRGNAFHIPWDYLTIQFDSVEDDEKNEDDRRLFYVAITRARYDVTITYSSKSLDGKEQLPTQFIGEIALPYQKIVITDEFEQEFLAHKEVILEPKKSVGHSDIDKMYKENTEYFAELFRRQGLSVTGLNNYLDCPWRYFFRTLLRIPEVKSPQEMFGSAIHKALSSYITMLSKGAPSEEFLLNEFRRALETEPANNNEFDKLLEKGQTILPPYYQEKASHWSGELISELNIYSIRFSDTIFLNGQIDMIEKKPGTKEVTVYDFKTGKPKSRKEIEGLTKNSTGAYKRQLIFYKMLLDRYMEGKMNMTTGVIEFIQADAKGTMHSEPFEITPEEIRVMEETIRTVASEIINLSFWDRTCDDPDCEYCRLRSFITSS